MIKYSGSLFLILLWLVAGCVVNDSATKKTANGLITTPPSYYSTAKAKYLGTKYKENLDRLVERIVRNPKTATLQFANNISSVGGIGFFTHSATKTPDERYLEVVLATPETFETKGEYSEKVHQLFSRYGRDLLGIVSGDGEVYQDRELSGYGLNLAWRTVIAEAAANRVAMARAIIYFPKERVRSYLRDEISQNELLGEAVIFGEEENGPLALVSYQPQNPRPDFRPAIREDNLALSSEPSKAVPMAALTVPTKEASGEIEPKIEAEQPKTEIAKKELPPAKEAAPRIVAKPKPQDTKAEARTPPVVDAGSSVAAPGMDPASSSMEKSVDARVDTLAKKSETPAAEPVRAETPVTAPRAEEVIPVVQVAPVPTVAPPKATPQFKPPETKPAAVATATTPSERVSKPLEEPTVTSPKAPAEDVRESGLKPPPAMKKSLPEIKASEQMAQPPKAPVPPKPVEVSEKAKTTQEGTPQQTPVLVVPIAKAPDKPSTVEENAKAAIPAKSEISATVIEPTTTPAVARQPEAPVKSSVPPVARQTEVKSPTAKVAREEIIPEPVAAKPTIVREEKPVIIPRKEIPEAKRSEPPKQQPQSGEIASVAKSETASQKIATPTAAPRENFEEKLSSTKTPGAATPSLSLTKAPQPAPASEPIKSTPFISSEKKEPVKESVVVESKPVAAPPTRPVHVEKASEKPAGEQLALLKNKPVEIVPERKILTRPSPKALEGFIIQLAFNDKEKAQNWAEAMERRGFAVSITETGTDGALRVRLGNFAVRDEAERQLRTFKQDGMSGIIINLPQAFRPEARSSIP